MSHTKKIKKGVFMVYIIIICFSCLWTSRSAGEVTTEGEDRSQKYKAGLVFVVTGLTVPKSVMQKFFFVYIWTFVKDKVFATTNSLSPTCAHQFFEE